MLDSSPFPTHRRARAARVLAVLFAPVLVLPRGSAAQQDSPVNYRQANRYSASFLRQFVYDTAVRPNWIGKSDSFWYSFKTSAGTAYYRVDPRKPKKEPLFDHAALAASLSEAHRKPMEANALPLTRVSLDEAGEKMKFTVEDAQYEYDLKSEALKKLERRSDPQRREGEPAQQEEQQQDDDREREQRRDRDREGGDRSAFETARRDGYRNYSPDRKAYVFARKHNLYLVEGGKEEDAVQLTMDGVEDYSFGGDATDRKVRPRVGWSPDSRAISGVRRDSRAVKELFLVNPLSTPRPTLEKYRYAMPGEEHIPRSELFVIERENRRFTKVPAKWKDESYGDLQWGKTAEELRFIRQDRLIRNVELCSLKPATGELKCVLAEAVEDANIATQPVQYLRETGELIWWSERSGWGHYYLYGADGKLKNAVSTGLYRASRIVSVDEKKRVLYFTANGREKGESIYNQHLYCVKLDGSDMTLMDPGDGNHQSLLSPSRKFVVDNCSRVDLAPASVLRAADGEKLMDLEQADLSRLQEVGWKMPETFTVKAADGVTDLVGNMWKPFDFSPGRKYPIILHVYPGPQQEGVTQSWSASSSTQQLAQLGFIVVQVGHRGGTPTRSKAYHSYGYANLRDYGLADKKTAVEQLAARHSFIDIERVGIYGHSGGGFMSAAAMLQKPYNEFFKAAVASAGNHDNNIYGYYWAERYHGLKEVPAKPATEGAESAGSAAKAEPPPTKLEIKVPTNAELAANLKGHLLLVHGDMDNNVHPANTMRLVDALIKANKRFEMLILPGKRHSFADYQPYFTRRMWEFFGEHLLEDRQEAADIEGLEPPSSQPATSQSQRRRQ